MVGLHCGQELRSHVTVQMVSTGALMSTEVS
jgi:hypothetical protein